MSQTKAVLVLEDGRVYTGTAFGAVGQTLGEAVFSTGMSGYQETLTDPSYHRQIVVATAPQIGNTGWNGQDSESRGLKIWVAGYVVRDPSPRASNWRATGTLEEELVRQGVVGIAGVDTRAIVRHLRTKGSMRAGVFSGPAIDRLKNSALEKVVITNTLPLPEEKRIDKIEVLSAAKIIADAIDAVFEDTSVSEIFDGQNQH